MIIGTVTSEREIIFRLSVYSHQNVGQEISAILDTGFTDFLTLSKDVIAALDLPFFGSTPVTLADGSEVLLDIYEVFVDWDGRIRRVQALSAEGVSLIGMSLLYGSQATLNVIDGGNAIIEPLP